MHRPLPDSPWARFNCARRALATRANFNVKIPPLAEDAIAAVSASMGQKVDIEVSLVTFGNQLGDG